MAETRMPIQKRSIEKRNRIIETGFKLMCEKGYYKITTKDIAKEANVSTGIVYQYFKDKKEIFLEGVKNYANQIMFPMIQVLDNEEIDIYHLDSLLEKMIDGFIKKHTISKKAHEELLAMEHLDEDVANIFKESELKMTNKIVTILKNNHIIIQDAKEKIHIISGIVDNFCHEIVYHQHKELNYEVMKEYVIDIIKNTLK